MIVMDKKKNKLSDIITKFLGHRSSDISIGSIRTYRHGFTVAWVQTFKSTHSTELTGVMTGNSCFSIEKMVK